MIVLDLNVTTDLALEAHEIASKNKTRAIDGVIYKEEDLFGFKMTRIEITDEKGEKETGKPQGKYLTLQTNAVWDSGAESFKRAVDATSFLIGELCKDKISKKGPVLVVGLGNVTITADAIGPNAVSHVIITRHLKSEAPGLFQDLELYDLAAIAPGVLGQTGIEACEVVKSLSNTISPSLIIAIDSLAARDIKRLGGAIQLTNTGIRPGSGIGNRRKALTEENIGVPVISIGIPTVVDAVTLAANVIEQASIDIEGLEKKLSLPEKMNFFVSPKDADRICEFMSKVIGYAVNTAFHRKLSFEEMISIAN